MPQVLFLLRASLSSGWLCLLGTPVPGVIQ